MGNVNYDSRKTHSNAVLPFYKASSWEKGLRLQLQAKTDNTNKHAYNYTHTYILTHMHT